jgi:hypothetical protein
MNHFLKIIIVISLDAYCYSRFYSIKIFNALDLNPANLTARDSFVVLKKSNEHSSSLLFNKTDENKAQKFTSSGKLFYELNSNPQNFLLLKKYIQKNELLFNLFLIYDTFSLREHTGGG